MSRASVLTRGQLAAAAGMTDTCTIRRVTGQTVDDLSGTIVDTYTDLYAGKCRIQQHQAQAARRDVGEADLLLLALEVQLPTSLVGLEVSDQITVTASGDPDLVGRVFLVRDLAHKTEATARRVQCTERTA